MILYHGSNTAVERILLAKCKPFKDFGCGFYTTTLEEQAWAMAERTMKRYGDGIPTVSIFELPNDWRYKGLSVKEFSEPSREWAQFVLNNRSRSFADDHSPDCNRANQYDIVIGPVANDRIAASFQLFLDDLISIDELVERLRYRKLNDQVSFHSQAAISLLSFKGACNER